MSAPAETTEPVIDQRAIASRVCARLAADDCPRQWRPRVSCSEASGRTYARVYIGFGAESYVFVTLEGLVRMSDALPVVWRTKLIAVLAEMRVLDVAPARSGLPQRGMRR